MGKQITVTCDSCGVDIFGKKYYTMNIRKVAQGKQTMNPAIYLCPKCFRETKLAMLLFDGQTVTEEVE
jgi:ribosomal protein L37AE/L43A